MSFTVLLVSFRYLLVNFAVLLVSFRYLLVSLSCLLVSFRYLLVNSHFTLEFVFPYRKQRFR
ncbi:hypothetical protein ACDX66_11720 [Peribacillus frigoritolerans]